MTSSPMIYEGQPDIPEGMTIQQWNAARRAAIALQRRARPRIRMLDRVSGIHQVEALGARGMRENYDA